MPFVRIFGLGLCASLAACGSHSFTAGLGGASSSSSPAPSVTTGEAPASREGASKDVYGPDGRMDKWAENGRLWTVLAGYTVEEARARAKAAGHNDRIEVGQLYEYDPACKDGVVCRADPLRWEIDESSTLTLWINKKVTISTPD
jgi:hypothetical protein